MLIALFFSTIVLFIAVCDLGWRYRTIKKRFAPVLSLKEEADRVAKEIKKQKSETLHEIEAAKAEAAESVAKTKAKIADLALAYDKAKPVYDRLQHEVSLLESATEEMSFGLYTPQYSFETPEKFKAELGKVFEKKKIALRNGTAATQVNNNAPLEILRQKLILRAFNGECDAAVASVKWNNAVRMEERIRSSYEAINVLGDYVKITPSYLKLCLSELHLTHEHELKKQEEKEKAREDRERMREEERAQRDFERAQREAAIERAKAERALAAAREALQKASGEHLDAIQTEIQVLEQRMADAQSKQDRAVSMAQLTKMGHVYVISNIGSFGENIFKIGMTRRLEPDDRIQELSGAAVPFRFDIHAMIFSEDAPGLEAALHARFADRRLNLVNPRKEYFRVTLDEIAEFAKDKDLKIELAQTPEAKQFRESEAMRLKALQADETPMPKEDVFPEQLFATVEDD